MGFAEGRRQVGMYPLIILLLSIVVYANTLQNAFVYDDFREVLENSVVHEFHFGDFWRIYLSMPDHSPPPARPIPLITYALNYAIGGLNPFGYHLVNVFLHGCVSLLIYGITVTLFPRGYRLAFIAAVFFACHPIHTDVVAPVAGRSELLASFCMLLTLWIYLRRTAEPFSRWSLGLWLTLPVFFLGAMSKATAWSLPLVLMGVDAYRFRTESTKKLSPAIFFYRLKKFYLPYLLLPTLIFLLILTIGYKPIEEKSAANFLFYLPFFERIIGALGIMMRYLVLLAFPIRLSCDYGFAHLSTQGPMVQTVWAAGGAGMLLLGVWAAYASFGRRGRYFLGIFIFTATYGIVSNMLVVINTPMAERLIYMPSWGFCLLLAMILEDLFRFVQERRFPKRTMFFLWLLVVAVTTAYSVRTWIRNRDWKDQLTLMSSAYDVCPMSGRVNNNLGAAYEQKGQLKKAIFHYEKAAAILPGNPGIHMGLGSAYAKSGDKEKARESFEKVVHLQPQRAKGYFNLGKCCYDLGLLAQASEAFERAGEIDPQNFDVWVNLGNIYLREGEPEKAADAYEKALALKPNSWQVHYWMGNACLTIRDIETAIQHYQRALLYRPRFKEAYNNMGVAYMFWGKREMALRVFRKALEVDPDYAEARRNMASLVKEGEP